MPHTITLASPEKLNDRLRKSRRFLEEKQHALPASDLQHVAAILYGQPNWQTLHGLVSRPATVTTSVAATTTTPQRDARQKELHQRVTAKPGETKTKTLLGLVRVIDEGYDLASHSTSRALTNVVGNWAMAMEDGRPLHEMLGDIDELCELLQDFKTAATEVAFKSAASAGVDSNSH